MTVQYTFEVFNPLYSSSSIKIYPNEFVAVIFKKLAFGQTNKQTDSLSLLDVSNRI